MTALAWPAVALVVALAVLWRVDAFGRRWAVGSTQGKRLSALEARVSQSASLDEVTVLRDKLTQLTNRLGPEGRR